MKRAGYRHAVQWIALNDGAGDRDATDVNAMRSQITVLLIADLFEVESSKVAQDVVNYRIKGDLRTKLGL
jgi:hypothetical protein